MVLPTYEKSWQYDLNKLVTSESQVLLQIKNSLIGFAQNAWTVVGSGNGVTAGMDGIDRWVTTSDLVSSAIGGSPKSWIVLKQTSILGNFQLLIAYQRSNPDCITVYYSPADGFTGGTTSVIPTATDQIILRDGLAGQGAGGGYYGTTAAAGTAYRLNTWLSADGQCTRIILYTNSPTVLNCYVTSMWFIERVKNPTSGWATPYIAGIIGNNAPTGALTGAVSMYSVSIFTQMFSSHHGPVTTMTLTPSCEGTLVSSAAQPLSSYLLSENKIDNLPPLYPIGLISTVAGSRGRHGQMFDLFWCTLNYAEGSVFTNEYGRSFIRIGRFFFPWPGPSTVLIKG